MADKKFQWSIFKNGKNEQFVVRSDVREEFKEDVEWIRDNYFDFAAEMDEMSAPMPTDEQMSDHKLEASGICKTHNVPMKPNKNGKLYHRKFEDGKASFCNGYGWS